MADLAAQNEIELLKWALETFPQPRAKERDNNILLQAAANSHADLLMWYLDHLLSTTKYFDNKEIPGESPILLGRIVSSATRVGDEKTLKRLGQIFPKLGPNHIELFFTQTGVLTAIESGRIDLVQSFMAGHYCRPINFDQEEFKDFQMSALIAAARTGSRWLVEEVAERLGTSVTNLNLCYVALTPTETLPLNRADLEWLFPLVLDWSRSIEAASNHSEIMRFLLDHHPQSRIDLTRLLYFWRDESQRQNYQLLLDHPNWGSLWGAGLSLDQIKSPLALTELFSRGILSQDQIEALTFEGPSSFSSSCLLALLRLGAKVPTDLILKTAFLTDSLDTFKSVLNFPNLAQPLQLKQVVAEQLPSLLDKNRFNLVLYLLDHTAALTPRPTPAELEVLLSDDRFAVTSTSVGLFWPLRFFLWHGLFPAPGLTRRFITTSRLDRETSRVYFLLWRLWLTYAQDIGLTRADLEEVLNKSKSLPDKARALILAHIQNMTDFYSFIAIKHWTV